MNNYFHIDPTLRRAYAYVVRNEAQGEAFVCRFDDIPEQGIIIAWYTTHAEAEQHAQSLRHIPKETILSKLINWCRHHRILIFLS